MTIKGMDAKEYRKKYYEEHKMYYRNKVKEWKKNNPEKYKENNKRNNQKRIELQKECTELLEKKITKAKKIIKALLRLWNDVMTEETVEALIAEAEHFLKEE